MHASHSSPHLSDSGNGHCHEESGHLRNYLLELQEQIQQGLLAAARKGWTPDDLRHLLGSRIDHLLFRTLSLLDDTVPAAIHQAWRRQCHPVSRFPLSTAALEECRDLLRQLQPLHDHALLGDGQDVADNDQALARLTPAQLKAHHRIRALLRKAESTTFEAEAGALVAKAQQLRQHYRIETVGATGPGEGDTPLPSSLQAQRIYLRAPWIKHQYSLLARIAQVNGCATMLLTATGIATVLGTGDDLRYVADLFASLNRQREHFMRTSPGAHEAAARGETSAYRRSFMIAYTHRLGELLAAASRSASGEAALPVLANRGVEAHRTLTRLFPRTRSLRLSSRHGGGYRDGVAAAQRSRLRGDSPGLTSALQ